MSESAAHIRLVEALAQKIIVNLLQGDKGYMYVHHPLECYRRPPIIANSVPDIYVPATNKNGLIIGEAKTSNDIENQHTYKQLLDYLRKCSQYDNSTLVIGVAWDMVSLMGSIVNQLKKDTASEKVQIIIPDGLSPWD